MVNALNAWLIQAWLATLTITENMTFIDAFYFVFISYTTIGFGDLVFDLNRYLNWDTWWLFLIVYLTFMVGIGTFAGATSAAVEIFPSLSICTRLKAQCCCKEDTDSYSLRKKNKTEEDGKRDRSATNAPTVYQALKNRSVPKYSVEYGITNNTIFTVDSHYVNSQCLTDDFTDGSMPEYFVNDSIPECDREDSSVNTVSTENHSSNNCNDKNCLGDVQHLYMACATRYKKKSDAIRWKEVKRPPIDNVTMT